MNLPLSPFPPDAFAPVAGAPAAGPSASLAERLVAVLGHLADLMLPLLVGLAGALSTWVFLEVARARHGRRARLPGRPPLWGASPPGLQVPARRGRSNRSAPASPTANPPRPGRNAGSDRGVATQACLAPVIHPRGPP